MAELLEARVPDIGGHSDVPVIELLVKPGDTVAKDQGLVTLESDKATMEVPSTAAGVVRELRVKVGDTLSEGGVVAVIEAEGKADAGAAAAAADTAATADGGGAKGDRKPGSTGSTPAAGAGSAGRCASSQSSVRPTSCRASVLRDRSARWGTRSTYGA